MNIKTLYLCENCNKEFSTKSECEHHEVYCANLFHKYEENVKTAISRIKSEYGSLISHCEYSVEDESRFCGDGDFYAIYHFNIEIKLSNGNVVNIYDGMDSELWLGNYLDADKIYASAKREIENRMSTSYEGVIDWQYVDGWRENYLGDIKLDDIVDRLRGKKVKIEVIE
jgi:hypothetical protein